ncbi:hypothetical protein [Lentzea albida]|uniref:DUF4177 domain-containing protein n=1 Tax=Lentzea albida TaxID=65499 RepID=A0A1H9F9Y4_9PSEU|nr:hypothetical protein [Lentzea albida]SEQ34707.1 hypothetical protein SAMN04488000_102596 [Lentzea albida]
MGLFSKTPEEIAAKKAAGELRAAEKEAARFAASPAGRARAAKADGARIFQISIELENTRTSLLDVVLTTQNSNNHTQTLNEIEAEGWRFEAISTTFIPQTTTITESSFSSGSNGETSGIVLATYVFRLA